MLRRADRHDPLVTTAPMGGSRSRGVREVGGVAVLVLAALAPGSTWWGWSRLVLQRWPLRGVSGLCFSKVLGSGHEGGFSLRPSGSRQGLFLVFDHEVAARHFIDDSAVMQGYRRRCSELCVAVLRVCTSKGSWSGTQLAVTAEPPVGGPIASLTRATVRPGRAWQFWRMQPAAEAALAGAPGCLLAAGVGEAPLLRQATFTLWRDAAAMDAYARSGAHAEAIRAAYGGGYFSESMFVRFVPVAVSGSWKGVRHG
jgi:heme-degrading monooxygenase HmoA